MHNSLPSLDMFYPPWKDISNKYETLFDNLKTSVSDPVHYKKREESLYWEHFGFELILTMLLSQGTEFNTSDEDVQLIVKDVQNTSKEIDFQIRINGNPVFFGVTHFHGRPNDLKKDVVKENTPVGDNNVIVSTRYQKEYLNRRIAVRIAREGKTIFDYDYIYILFPKLDIGFGGGLDVIPLGFQFDYDSNYKYKPVAMTGLILIGSYIETKPPTTYISEDKLLVRTLAFETCSPHMSHILSQLDNMVIDMTKRNQQVRNLLKKRSG